MRDLLGLMGNVKRMLEEDKKELQQCIEERKRRDEEKESRRAEKDKDIESIQEMLLEVQTELEVLKAVRVDGESSQDESGSKDIGFYRTSAFIEYLSEVLESGRALLTGVFVVSRTDGKCTMSFKVPRDISRPPLITPSASPPPVSLASRSDVAPPSKRQRLASASRSSSLRRSVSASDSNLDVQKEREASRARLLDTWSQLAERYSRPLDEDDIVDIRTGEIVKDNGFWRATRQFKFGEVLAPEDTDARAVEDSEDEDGIDELDAFPDEHDFLEDVFARGLQPDPLAKSLESGGEDDLTEFLEAEKKRREEYGSDLDEGGFTTSYANEDNRTTSPSPTISNDFNNCDEDDRIGSRYLPDTSYESGQEDPASDDELDNWEPTEASMVVVAGTVLGAPSIDGGSDVESEVVVETPEPVSNPPPKQRTPPAQLHTPPHSHSSVDQPIMGCIEIPLPSPPSIPPHSEPRRPRKASVSPKKPEAPAAKSKTRTPRRQVPTTEVIEFTDDEAVEAVPKKVPSSVSPPPSPVPVPSSLPPIVRARSRAQSLVPQVVISTLPPRLEKSNKTTVDSPAKSKKPTRSTAPSKSAVPSNPPKRTTRLESPSKASPVKKSSQKTKSVQPEQKAAKTKTKSRSVRHSPSLSEDEEFQVSQDKTSSIILRKPNPEVSGRPVTPVTAAPVPRVSSSLPRIRTSHKRKRSSSVYEANAQQQVADKTTRESTTSQSRVTKTGRTSNNLKTQTRQSSRSKSKRLLPPEEGSPSSSDESVDDRRSQTIRRFASVSASSTIQPPYTPHATPSHHPVNGMYAPIADPRAQQIITSAMQQLAALLWTPPTHSNPATPMYPYTPAHHRFSSVGPSFVQSTPDHPHPYPFSFDPAFSKATFPPSSPDPPSSPVKPRERKKSLVARSHSRGRRVSFSVDENGRGCSDSDSESSTSDLPQTSSEHHQRRKNRSISPIQRKSKGKGGKNAVERHISPSESEYEEDEGVEDNGAKPPRTKPLRGQTPGPESSS
ncbi:hypothetical protein AN958_00336 [Leucoagaricus sp. SymC.cos]|nr:hypothetical protein AN958_00336 [Leucoagaricus sp. SymC.cos]